MGLQPCANVAPCANVILASGSPRRKALLTSIGVTFSVCVPEVDETLEPQWGPAEAVEQLAYRKGRAVAGQLVRQRTGRGAPTAAGAFPPCGLPADEPSQAPPVCGPVAVEAPVLVIAADTIVVLDGEVMGKPADTEDAYRMLRRLSGRQHEVYSGVAVLRVDGTDAVAADGRREGNGQLQPVDEGGQYRVVTRSPSGEPLAMVGHTRSQVTFGKLTDGEIAAYIKTGEPLDKAGAYGIQGMGAVFIEKIEGDFYSVMGLPLRLLYQMLLKFGVNLFRTDEKSDAVETR